MANMPAPYTVAVKTREAILRNQRPRMLLFDFLSSGSKEANVIANWLIDYKEAIKILTSKEGRAYLHYWLDDTLNYLQKYANEAQKTW